ncbi:MAG: EAL domain-containing protein [Timaviella obliquedivisa GSE-PSE-MK23-08B]|nr:EAL domain-containing protein [Timaviella obliquedivisa GSE-PSE-MK23-08B]
MSDKVNTAAKIGWHGIVIVIDRRQPLRATPLNHPLEPYAPFIKRLMQFLGECSLPIESPSQILEAIRCALNVDFVAVLRQESGRWDLIEQSQSNNKDSSLNPEWKEAIFTQVSDRVSFHSLERNTHQAHGIFQSYEEDGIAKFSALVPLLSRQSKTLMVIGGAPPESIILSDVCGQILISLDVATCGFSTLQLSCVEAAILDDLRRTYGFAPSSLYHRRFELFCDRLSHMHIHFEPVLRLDPDYPYIDSWEALARDPMIDCAPIDLFEAAELWGDRFMVHLDAYLMRQSVERYRYACQFHSGRRQEDIRELSVNVYPPSLMQDEYFESIRHVVQDKLIQPEKLILEISEKLPLPESIHRVSPMEAFRRQLGRYVRDLKVGFSIDDFGAGHASVSRLTRLNPSHVKIDRELLYQEQEATEITLRFVLDLASSTRLRAPKVVVEGFDDGCPITLGQLYRVGIRYVQGHIIGKASPDLNRLGRDHTTYLRQLIQESGTLP